MGESLTRAELEARVRELETLVIALAERIAGQSEALSMRAAKAVV